MSGAHLCSLHGCLDRVLQAQLAPARARGVQLFSEIRAGVPDQIEADADHVLRLLASLVSDALAQCEGGILTVRLEGLASSNGITVRFWTDSGSATPPSLEMTFPVPAPAAASSPVASEPGLRILLAEDNLVNQKVASKLLERRGHTVTVVANGVEALSALREWVFDLILMDVQMPEMDGLEATRHIRNHERSSGDHIPILAMTAHAMKGDKERCLAAGMDAYISKPIQVQTLIQTIHSLVAA